MSELIGLLTSIFDEKIVAWLVLIGFAIPTAWVVYKFFVEGIKNSTQKYYELKLELCKEIAHVTAKIATSTDAKEIRAAAIRFDELYWGQLVLVEDPELEAAMVSYRGLIVNSDTQELALENLTTGKIKRAELRSASLRVAFAGFNLLQPRWWDQLKALIRTQQKGKKE